MFFSNQVTNENPTLPADMAFVINNSTNESEKWLHSFSIGSGVTRLDRNQKKQRPVLFQK